MIKITNHVILVLFIFLVITYWRVPFIFFQQDEWMGFALIISNGFDVIFRGLGDHVIHFIPITNLLNFLSFNLFGLNSIFYNIIGLLLHFLNSFLIFKISLIIFKNKKYALLSAVIFITSAISSQLIMWPLVSLNIISLTFTLFVWKFILDYYQHKNLKRLNLKIALFTLLALLTLEYSLGLLIFVPLSLIVFTKKKDIKKVFIFIIPFLFVICFYFVIRIYPLFITSETSSINQDSNLSVILFKILRFPERYLGQLFISESQILFISDFFSSKFNLAKEIFYSKISFYIGTFIITLCLYWLIVKRKILKSNFKYLLIVLVFILSSSLPFILVPGRGGDFLLFPPRYLYYGLAGSSILIVLLFKIAEIRKNLLLKVIIGAVILISLTTSIEQNNNKVNELYNQGKIRKDILTIIKNSYPVLHKKVVFYTESDTPYYGLPVEEKTLPFQSGFGQTLLIWYYATEKYPKDFYQNKFLWEITDQGYKEANGRGFGYFRDFKLLKSNLKKYSILPSSVIAFSWYDRSHSFIDITERIQKELEDNLQ